MKIGSFFCLITSFGIASLVLGETPSKNPAVSPALHPGTGKKHKSFNEVSRLGEASLVFLEDSITAGWNGRGKDARMKYRVPLKAANFGIGGDRTEHVLWRL